MPTKEQQDIPPYLPTCNLGPSAVERVAAKSASLNGSTMSIFWV